MLQKGLLMNYENEVIKIKQDFLKDFFNQVQDLNYGVIDIDDNLGNKIENDLDIWVKKENLRKFVQILFSCAKSNNWIIKRMEISPRIHGREEAKYALLLPSLPFCVIQFDVWVDFHWRSFPMLDCNFEDYIESKNYYKKISNEKALYMQILKDLLYKGEIKEKVRKRIESVSDNFTYEFSIFLKGYYSLNLQQKLIDNVRYDEASDLNSSDFRRSLIINTIKNRFILQLKYLSSYIFRFIYIRIFSQDGIHVVLLGPDGAGKTTIGNLIYESELVNDFYEKKSYEHTRFKILPPLQKIASLFKTKNKEQKEYVPREIEALPANRAMIYPFYYVIDYILGFLWLYKMKTNGGSFVMFDRYFDEYYVQQTFSNVSKKYLKLIERFVPKPTLYILISNEPKLIYQRKQELPLEEIEKQISKYTELVKSKDGHIVINNKSPEVVANEVLTIICNKLRKDLE